MAKSKPNIAPIIHRLKLLSDLGRIRALSVLEVIPECGFDNFPSKKTIIKKLQESIDHDKAKPV